MRKNKEKLITYKRCSNDCFRLKSAIGLIKKNNLLFASGRGALHYLLQKLNFKNDDLLLLPSIVPEGLLLPIKHLKIKYEFYKSYQLVPDIEDILKLVHSNKVKIIIIIHFFGYPQNIEKIKSLCNKNNIILFEDCAQAFKSCYSDGKEIGTKGHVALFSLEKFIPVSDGAILKINDNNLFNKMENINYSFSFFRLISHLSNRLFLFLQPLASKETILIIKLLINCVQKGLTGIFYFSKCYMKNPAKISEFSFNVYRYYNYKKMLYNRKENTKYLLTHICNKNKIKIFRSDYYSYNLTGLPIITKSVYDFKKFMSKHNVETLSYRKRWYFFNKQEGHYFKQIILIPINENYYIEDMTRLAEIINNY